MTNIHTAIYINTYQQHKQCAGQTARVVRNVNQSSYSSH